MSEKENTGSASPLEAKHVFYDHHKKSAVVEAPRVDNPQRVKYTDEFRLKCLERLNQNQGNVRRTSREMGVVQQTLRRWALQAGTARTKYESVEAKRQVAAKEKVGLADAFEALAERYLRRAMGKSKLELLTGLELVKAAAIATEKMISLKVDVTKAMGNVPMAEKTEEQIQDRLLELMGRIQQLSNAPKPTRIIEQLPVVRQEMKDDLTP